MQLDTDLAVLNVLDEGVVAVDADSMIVFFNAAAERIFGYPVGDALGRPLELLIPEVSHSVHRRHVEAFGTAKATSRMKGERSDVRGRRQDGSVFDAEVSICKSTIGGSLILMAIIRDVTERKAAEARLLASEQKHRAILATCTDAILIAEAETGLIVEANKRAGELFDCAVTDLVGLHQGEFHLESNCERVCREFREHAEAGRILAFDTAIRRRDGTVVPVEITTHPTVIAGTLVVVSFFRDITHRREHERELIEAREAAMAASRTKTTFLANVSHELRTPLNAVIALAEMIGREFFGPVGHPKYVEYAHDIQDSGRHLLDLISDILDLSRVEIGKVVLHDEDIDLVELIDQCQRTVRQLVDESGLVCDYVVDPTTPRLRADRRAVRQMLLNLLSNAVRHTPRGGRIRIAAEPAGDGGLALSVTDTGIGIPSERLARVTIPFNSSNERIASGQDCTGLGLAITKGLLERHGGRLEIRSRQGAGTSVHLLFPSDRRPITMAV